MNELFIIAPQTLAAADKDEVDKTVAALREMGLYHLPFPKVDVQFAVDMPDEMRLPKGTDISTVYKIIEGKARVLTAAKKPTCIACRFIGLSTEGTIDGLVMEMYPPDFRGGKIVEGDPSTVMTANNGKVIRDMCDVLIVLLATRNAQKTVRENKLVKLGIGRKHKGCERGYARITTITLPEEMENDSEHPPTGRTVCAHLRRGHIRRQHYGPQRSFIKQIWIEPVFVNADETFVSQRKGYNLSF